MAELISGNRKGLNRRSTRIDLTPMVDLGFLLITFFLFTTTMLKSNTMEVVMPADQPKPPDPTVIAHHVAMKIYMGKNHHLFCLTGIDAMNNNFMALHQVNMNGSHSLREAIAKHHADIQEAVEKHIPGAKATDKSFILLKPTSMSDYSDMVNVLDELSISGVGGYAIMELDEDEKKQFETSFAEVRHD